MIQICLRMIGTNTLVHVCRILGRGGSSWLGWGERADGTTSRFVSSFICPSGTCQRVSQPKPA